MGYKVRYPLVGKQKYPQGQKLPKWAVIAGIFWAFAAIILVFSYWQGGISYLLPGDPEVTGPALQSLIDKLSDGQPLGKAVAAFCREVVAGAG